MDAAAVHKAAKADATRNIDINAPDPDRPKIQTKQESEEEWENFLTKNIGAPGMAIAAGLGMYTLAGVGSGGLPSLAAPLARGTGVIPGVSSGVIGAGLGRVLSFSPSLIAKFLAPAVGTKWANVLGWAIFIIVEGHGVAEPWFCGLKYNNTRLYDDIFKYIDPFHWISSAFKRMWPGGEIGNVFGASEQYGGLYFDPKKPEDYNTFLDIINRALTNPTDRQRLQRLRNGVNTAFAELKNMERDNAPCPDLWLKLQQIKQYRTLIARDWKNSIEKMEKSGELDEFMKNVFESGTENGIIKKRTSKAPDQGPFRIPIHQKF